VKLALWARSRPRRPEKVAANPLQAELANANRENAALRPDLKPGASIRRRRSSPSRKKVAAFGDEMDQTSGSSGRS